MMRGTVVVVALAAFVYLAACAALFFFQRSLIYFPQPSLLGSSSQIQLPVHGAELRVSVRPRAGPDALIYFGGNAEDVSASLPSLATAFPDHALFLMHYRGYGGSSGAPSEPALQDDALKLFDKIHADHPNVVVVGRSLGTGIAIRLAAQRPVSRLVLVTPYDSLQDLAAAQFPIFPVRWLLYDKYESGRYAPLVTAPTTIVAAEHDEVIPRWSTNQLHARFAQGVARFVILPGTGHNTISMNPVYLDIVRGAR
ncbi:alpha/beta hydrolase [Caenimonas soli]|jgi:pimeloyl-ACP methyl ester carboxylesterase|uniref:alpha/beta hydrolase n=1 Tax=Caenimonas soli TaxID=2735555 RepID=UPI001A9ABA6E|nr:alpha/beta fold hydrolase [Caenimonas soli]